MKYSTVIFNLLILIGFACDTRSDSGPVPSDIFVKYYGTGTCSAVDIIDYSDPNGQSGYLILATKADVRIDNDFFIIKTDDIGNELKTLTIDPNSGQLDDVPRRIIPFGDNQYLIAGYSIMSGVDQYRGVYFTINTGLEVSNMHVDTVGFQIKDVVQTTETDGVNKFVLVGNKTISADVQIHMSKRDLNDNIYWEKDHGFVGSEDAIAIIETDDNNLMTIATTEAADDGGSNNSQGLNLYVLPTTDLGTPNGAGFHSPISGTLTSADDIPYALKKTFNGYSVVGTSKNTANQEVSFLMTFNSKGEKKGGFSHVFLYETSQDTTGMPCEAFTFTTTVANDLMVFGEIPNYKDKGGNSFGDQIMSVRVSPSDGLRPGLRKYSDDYGTSVGDDYASAAITLPDGNIAVAATIDFGGTTTLVGLLHLNQNGQLVK